MVSHFHVDWLSLEKRAALIGADRHHRDMNLKLAKSGYCFGKLDQEFNDYFFGKKNCITSFCEMTSGYSWAFSGQLDDLVKKCNMGYYAVGCTGKVFEPKLLLVGMMRGGGNSERLRRAELCDARAGNFLCVLSDNFNQWYDLGFFGDGPEGVFTGQVSVDSFAEVKTPVGLKYWRAPDLDGLNKQTLLELSLRHEVRFNAPNELRAELCANYDALLALHALLFAGKNVEQEFLDLRNKTLSCWESSDRFAAQHLINWIKKKSDNVAIQTSPFYALSMRVFEEEAVKNGIDYVALVPCTG